jgi:copper chaperone NosL
MKALLAALAGLGLLVLGVLVLRPARTGPEPIAYGRDTCAHCRMHLSQPGFAGELRDRHGTLTKYDDLGCLLRAMVAMRAEVPEAWVEDHGGGGLVPLLGTTLVRSERGETPMGSGIVAFADAAAADAFVAASAGRRVALDDLLRDRTLLVPATARREGR